MQDEPLPAKSLIDALKSAHERVNHIQKMLLDETTKRRQTEEKLACIASNLFEGVVIVDSKGNITFTNTEAERALGYGAGELLGGSLHTLVHRREAGAAEARCPLDQVRLDGLPCLGENDVFYRKDGSSINVAFVSTPIIR